MPWFRVDDSFNDHPKVKAIPRGIRLHVTGLWLACGNWSARHLTDGYIPEVVPEEYGGKARDVAALVGARAYPGGVGLWVPDLDGWQFHDWADYQPTRKAVQAKRDAGAERIRRYRERRAQDEGETVV